MTKPHKKARVRHITEQQRREMRLLVYFMRAHMTPAQLATFFDLSPGTLAEYARRGWYQAWDQSREISAERKEEIYRMAENMSLRALSDPDFTLDRSTFFAETVS